MSLSLSQLATHAARALQQQTAPTTVAYAWPHGWSGGETITVDGHVLPLRHCQCGDYEELAREHNARIAATDTKTTEETALMRKRVNGERHFPVTQLPRYPVTPLRPYPVTPYSDR